MWDWASPHNFGRCPLIMAPLTERGKKNGSELCCLMDYNELPGAVLTIRPACQCGLILIYMGQDVQFDLEVSIIVSVTVRSLKKTRQTKKNKQ